MDSSKIFTALLNGIAKRTFFGEKEFDNETLRSQLYPAMAVEGELFLWKFFGNIYFFNHFLF